MTPLTPSLAAEPAAPMSYLVWATDHDAWWAPDRCGYVQTVARAGRYTAEEVCDILCNDILGEQRVVRAGDASDTSWPAMSRTRGKAVRSVAERERCDVCGDIPTDFQVASEHGYFCSPECEDAGRERMVSLARHLGNAGGAA